MQILIVASLIFYGLSGLIHAIVLIGCVIWVFLVVDRFSAANGDLRALWLAIVGPLAALAYFKYSGFLVRDIFMLGTDAGGKSFDLFQNIILPAGISFFSFQLIAYAIDRYQGKIAEPIGFTNLLFFISFFPQLVAGPIVRFHQVADGLHNLSRFKLTAKAISEAVIYLVAGLAFKVLLADSINHFSSSLISAPESLGATGLTALVYSYTFQIYFDFYGYSLCAIGLARLFGIRLPCNFLRPYSSLNPQHFWRCWHVSLSNFIRDYVYIPLGGHERYIRNIFIVFLVCGLWHGAGFSFIIWGAYHFVLVGGYKLLEKHWNRLPEILQWAMNFSLVSFGWLFFVYPIGDFLTAFTSVFKATSGAVPSMDLVAMTAIAAFICFAVRIETLVKSIPDMSPAKSFILSASTALIAVLILLFIDRSENFIYFRF
tara:strand:+ start:66 stop:1352 length:1287 start_codon:yes stop_codon:yes gene_type:complete